jgi:pyruvate dehydrogenase E1 component
VRYIAPKDAAELDATETREWLDSLDYVLQSGGPAKVARLLRELTIHARQNGVKLPFTANTPYINTISADEQALMPGSPDLERRIKSLVRWNAAAMVVRANKAEEGIGGHISTFASAATLYEVGFNHFFRGHDDADGDVIFFQGHAAPGIYARAYLEGRIDETHLENFRRETQAGRRALVVPASVADARTSGNTRPSRWASARSWRSTRRASSATSRIAG